MDKSIQTFQGITEKSLFIENKNGKKNIKEYDMNFQKKNDEPGFGELNIRNNKQKQKYFLSEDSDILKHIRMTRKKKRPLHERLERLLSRKKTFKKKKRKQKKDKPKNKPKNKSISKLLKKIKNKRKAKKEKSKKKKK